MADSSSKPGERPARVEEEEEEERLFLRALDDLKVAPDKDARVPVPEKEAGVRRLKSSKSRGLEPQDRLDLHGKRVEEALWRLREFVVGCALRRLRHVLVVTGKGLHSEGGTGVLKKAVEGWILDQGRRYIRAYSEASRRHGGSGAFLLYLRTGRSTGLAGDREGA